MYGPISLSFQPGSLLLPNNGISHSILHLVQYCSVVGQKYTGFPACTPFCNLSAFENSVLKKADLYPEPSREHVKRFREILDVLDVNECQYLHPLSLATWETFYLMQHHHPCPCRWSLGRATCPKG